VKPGNPVFKKPTKKPKINNLRFQSNNQFLFNPLFFPSPSSPPLLETGKICRFYEIFAKDGTQTVEAALENH